VIDKVIPVRADTPMGRDPVKLTAATAEAQWAAVDKQVREWTQAGIKPGQIAVVTARRTEEGCAYGRDRIGNVSATADLDLWRAGRAVLVSTVGKFKGLETDALVLTDVPAIGQGFRKEHLYVGCSRARHLLTVVFLNGEPDWF
jgi:hypothetical protein